MQQARVNGRCSSQLEALVAVGGDFFAALAITGGAAGVGHEGALAAAGTLWLMPVIQESTWVKRR